MVPTAIYRKVRMLAKGFARIHIADMYFDEWQVDGQQGVTQCDTCMGECAGVQDNEIGGTAGLLDPVHEFGLRIALECGKAMAEVGGLGRHLLFNLSQRRAAVDIRFARAEQVQVRAVDEQDMRHCNKG